MANVNMLSSWIGASLASRFSHMFNPRYVGDLTTEDLFIMDHFRLRVRDERARWRGLGAGSVEGMRRGVEQATAALRDAVREDAPPGVRRALQEDLRLLAYTCLVVSLFHELAEHWRAAKYAGPGSRAARRHADRALALGKRLERFRMAGADTGRHALAMTGVAKALQALGRERPSRRSA